MEDEAKELNYTQNRIQYLAGYKSAEKYKHSKKNSVQEKMNVVDDNSKSVFHSKSFVNESHRSCCDSNKESNKGYFHNDPNE